jgi:hypothetical protein
MGIRLCAVGCLAFVVAVSASAQDYANRIFDVFTGRYSCGGHWTDFQFRMIPATGPLGILDPDADVTASITITFHRSITSIDGARYTLAGSYDPKTGRFHLEPKRWLDPHPAAFEMIGIDGTFDAATGKTTAKMLSNQCDAVEMVPPGVTLPPLPVEASTPARVRDPKRVEMLLAPSDLTNYLDSAAYNDPGLEYLVTAWFDPPGTVHDGDPIDESVERMKKDKFACAGSQHVTWDASGIKGTAPDRVNITERYVVECAGDCKGVFYRPYAGAQVVHFGLTEPLPTMQIKSVMFGGTTFRWNFSRTNQSQPPPEIYIHRWTPLAGFGPFDAGPAEVARQQAAAPPCKAPKTNGK